MSDLTITPSGAPADGSYLTINNETGLTQERRVSFNTTNLSTTDGGANNVYSVNTIQNIDTTATPTFQRILLSGSTNQKAIAGDITLDGASGTEIGYELDFTVNQSGTATATGIKLNVTDTASPNSLYLMDLQKGTSTKFRVDENGNLECGNITGQYSPTTIFGGTSASQNLKLQSTTNAARGSVEIVDNILFDGTVFKTSASSFTIRDQINRDLLVVNATDFFINYLPVTIEQNVTIQGSTFITPTASSGGVSPALTTTTPAHTNLTASTEFPDLLIDMSATKTWLTGTVANQRCLKILAPNLNMTSVDTFTECSTVYIQGPPTPGLGALATTAIGFKMDTINVTSRVTDAAGFVIYAPSGAFNSNTCGSFMNGSVGINTLSPKCSLDIKPTSLPSSAAQVCIDGVTRYGNVYIGGTQYTSLASSGAGLVVFDHGIIFGSATSNNSRTIQSLFTLSGANNYTGTQTVIANTMIVNTSAGTATNINGNQVVITTSSVANITTSRAFLASFTPGGTGTIGTYVAYDATFSSGNVAGTGTNTIGVRINNMSKGAAYTATNFYGVRIEDQTATIGTDKIGFYQLGTNLVNRLVGDTAIGIDANPGATLDVASKFYVAGATGTVTKYNNQTTSGTGVGYILQGLATSATKTANFTVFSYTPAASAQTFRVYGVISTTSATNTGTVSFTLDYVDSNGTTHTADIIPLVDAAGAVATTKSGASKEFHMIPWLFTINNSATAVALKVVITGTVSYTVTAALERVI